MARMTILPAYFFVTHFQRVAPGSTGMALKRCESFSRKPAACVADSQSAYTPFNLNAGGET
ncbi:hypothetical protein GIW69_22990 [Pseudomonas syringae]|nr:hypothetical protein [Pseudomonas syringae]